MTDLLLNTSTSLLPANEPERLAALYRYDILDTSAEVAFDRITTLAARLFKIPTVLISLVDESRAWFKSSVGFEAREVPRDATICSFAVLSDEPLIVPDTQLDDRFACNPFVLCEPGLRFYAGAPLIDRDGFNLGTLCLLDTAPRDPLTAEQQATLVDLAAMVVDELELRLAVRQIATVDAALLEITRGVATVTGGAFAEALVLHLAKVLNTDYVYIGLIEGDDSNGIRTIATCAHGSIVDNLEYPLQGTPCWDTIVQRKICCHPRNVQVLFPNAPLLKPLGVESYVAIPFCNDRGEILGVLGVMNGKPLENVQLAASLLTLFATRIATELERQQAEASLQRVSAALDRQLQRFDAIASSVTDYIYTFDLSGRFTYVNQPLLDLWQRPLDRAIGKNLHELDYPTELANHLEDCIQRVIATRQPIKDETAYTSFQGTKIYEYVFVPLFSQANAVEGVAGISRDITERKQAEDELRQAQAQAQSQLMEIEAIYQTAPIGLTILDGDLRYQRINQQLAEINGISIADHIGRTLREIIPDLADEAEPLMRRVLETGEPVLNLEISGETNSQPGIYRTWVQNYYPLKDGTGQIVGINAVVEEITDRKQSQLALEASERKFSAIFNQTFELLGLLNFDGVLLEINQAALESVGAVRTEIVGKPFWETPWWKHSQELQQQLRSAIDRAAQGEFICYEVTFPTVAGTTMTTNFSLKPIYDDDDRVTTIIAEGYDITERKRIEFELQAQKAELVETARLLELRNQELNQFSYAVSHDLKAPLRAIINLSQWIEDDLDTVAPEVQTNLELMRSRIRRMDNLIDGLLEYARLGSTERSLTTFAIEDLLVEIVDSLDIPASFTLDLPSGLPPITTNRILLDRVLANLIGNAYKHHDRPDGKIRVTVEPQAQMWEITVSDDGIGIAPKDRERVFGIFQTISNPKQQSTGIGLAIVEKIVKSQGGNISIGDSIDRGTTFRFTWSVATILT